MPELRLVVLALQDRLAYGSTYEAALSALFEGTGSSLTASSEPQTRGAGILTRRSAADCDGCAHHHIRSCQGT